MQVLVRDNNVDQALRVLKKKMQREGVFREMRQRKAYEKPSERKAREKADAIRRARKQARKTAIREGLIAAPKPKPRVGGGRARPGMSSGVSSGGELAPLRPPRTGRETLASSGSYTPASGRTPCRHRTNRSGSRRAMRPSQCIAARSRRRNRVYFRCAHFPRASLK